MPDVEKKGITVKIDAELHAQVRDYIESHNMTMAEFVTQALDNELHPKTIEKEGNFMENTRTIAFQVPEELYQRIKDYLHRNNMTQKQFMVGLIEDELQRNLDEREANTVAEEDLDEEAESAELGGVEAGYKPQDAPVEESEGVPAPSENPAVGDFEAPSDESEADELSEGETEDEDEGFSMSM